MRNIFMGFLFLLLPFCHAHAAKSQTIEVLLLKDRYVLKYSDTSLNFTSQNDKIHIDIKKCNKAHVHLILEEIKRQLDKNPKLFMEHGRRIAGMITVIRKPEAMGIPEGDERAQYIASLPQIFSELWVASQRRCGK